MQLDEVQLDVLPRRDVAEAARVAFGDVGHRVELIAGQDALRNLDPHHLRVAGLPLPVGAAQQAKRAPLVGTNLSALELREQRRRTRRCPIPSQTTTERGRTFRDPA